MIANPVIARRSRPQDLSEIKNHDLDLWSDPVPDHFDLEVMIRRGR